MVIYSIFSVTRYTQLIPAQSVSQKLLLIIVPQNILIKSWMMGKTFTPWLNSILQPKNIIQH